MQNYKISYSVTQLPITELLQTDDFTAYFTSRGQCEAASPYDGFNLCHYTGDTETHASECLRNLSRHFGISTDRIVIPRQTHSSNVCLLTDDNKPLDTRPDNVDAIVTDLRGLIIGVNTADCVPVVLLDPVRKTCGVAHAGWRGAVGGIVEATITAMASLGSHPRDIKVALGPSICVDCFEVGEETARYFPENCIVRRPDTKPHVSLQKYIMDVLMRSGLKADNIEPFSSSNCTRCHPDRLWSARRLGINSGRIYTFIVIKGQS